MIDKQKTRKLLLQFLLLLTIMVFLTACTNENTAPVEQHSHTSPDYSNNPKVSILYRDTAMRPDPSSLLLVTRIPKNAVLPVLSFETYDNEVWYEVQYQSYSGWVPQDMVEVVSLGNGSIVLPDYDEYAYAGEKATGATIQRNQAYIDLFVGTWFCDKSDSVNNMNIELIISCSDGRMHYVRNMGNGGYAGSSIEYATAIPTSNSVYSSHTSATLIIENGVLFEKFSNGKKNAYVRSDGTDYAASVPADSNNTDAKGNNETPNDSLYQKWAMSQSNGKCILSYCDRSASPGKPYCTTHSCCLEDCENYKDPSDHCCSVHSCSHEGCGLHRYDFRNSIYCKVHDDEH